MEPGITQHTVQIGDTQCEVTVTAMPMGSRMVFVAEGTYAGRYAKTKGSSELQTVASWREVVRLKVNR